MTRRVRRLELLVLIVAITAWSAAAGPKIEVDKADYDDGVIREGAKDTVSHVFTLKNTGDEVLRIKQVKPG
ncbi:MAG: DUF1573 domain-containing protein [Chitinivibrionales bacterium]|nr:DUF1573 domain-containing protein [Chitinivibrionales bacterium]MBD3395245.1 DUF1573 domain-containing protein [Chitinivibrionales bacterium]